MPRRPLLSRVKLPFGAQIAQETLPLPSLVIWWPASTRLPSTVFLGVRWLSLPFPQVLLAAILFFCLLTQAPHSPFLWWPLATS